jgi:hypothetical protein
MIERHEAAGLVTRFAATRGFDFLSEDGIESLTEALRSASTIEQAQEVTQWLIDNMPDRPTPADIRARIAQTPASAMPSRDQSCPHCAGKGLRIVWSVECEGKGRGTVLRRILCGTCAARGETCQALVVPLDIPDKSIGGMLYCEARAKQVMGQGMTVVRSAEACPNCRYGQSLRSAMLEREAEWEAKKQKRNGER